jgi:hypothetical protein
MFMVFFYTFLLMFLTVSLGSKLPYFWVCSLNLPSYMLKKNRIISEVVQQKRAGQVSNIQYIHNRFLVRKFPNRSDTPTKGEFRLL